MNDKLIFDEAIEAQIYTAQYAPKSIQSLLLFLTDLEKRPLTLVEEYEIREAFKQALKDLEFDEEVIGSYNYYSAYEAVFEKAPQGRRPTEEIVSPYLPIQLHTNSGSPIILNPADKIVRLRNSYLNGFRSIKAQGQQNRVASLNKTHFHQFTSLVNTFLAETMNSVRQSVYTFLGGEPWLAGRPENFQRGYLGKKAYAKYEKGELTPTQTVKALTRRFRTAEDLLSKIS
jgi:hypothetical protein